MKIKLAKQPYLLFLVLYFVLNILNTYFLTIQDINKYIAPFKHSLFGEINALLGNFSVLLLFYLIICIIFKKTKNRMKSLLFITLVLNLFVFLLGFFNLYYGTAFSYEAFDIFRNPAGGIAHGMLGEFLYELFIYYRIAVFAPIIILSISYVCISKKYKNIPIKTITPIRIKQYLIITFVIALTFVTSLYGFVRSFRKSDLPVQSAMSTYAVQNFGVYPFYLTNLLGVNYNQTNRSQLGIETDDELRDAYQKINKNQIQYQNILDGKYYSNQLYLDDLNNVTYIDQSLIDGELINGIFKDKNIVLIQLETINYYLFEIPEIKQRFKFLNKLLEESYVFENYYTTVGMGVSADAEVSVLTGLYPNGHSTLYWDYNETKFDLDTIPKLFNQKNYSTQAIHGDYARFYNRDVVYYNDVLENSLMGFNKPYYSLESYMEDYPGIIENGYIYDKNREPHKSPWISDFMLADTISKFGQEEILNNQKFMLFPITMMPHTPFEFHPEPDRIILENQNKLNKITQKYINFSDYYDKIFKNFFLNEKGENEIDTNTVYLFYGDHGSGLKNGDLNVLFNRKERMSSEEERKHLLHVEALLYVPSKVIKNINGFPINEGLIKGVQDKVRGHIDIYRTIIELFGLNANNDFYVGANLLSDEETFVLDNKLLDVVLDNQFYSMRYIKKTFPSNMDIDKETFEYIKKVKLLNDLLYKDIKRLNKVNRFLNKENKNDGN